MKRVLKLNGVEREFEVSPEAQIAAPEPNVYSILLDGRVYEARISGTEVIVNGHRFQTEIVDPRQWNRNASAGGADGVQAICSPMPGKLIRALVSAGDTVAAGQGIIVVEAMKMQNEIKSPRAGRVLTLNAKEGATVTAGEILATIE